MALRLTASDAVAEAKSGERRPDQVLPHGGGPAGNVRLTAWTGMVLLLLFLVELGTLLDLHNLLDWHVVVGALLIPPALLKTGSTTWRMVSYRRGRPGYRAAGQPRLALRVLGLVVVFSTLAVLGSGLALVAVGPTAAVVPFAHIIWAISPLTVHEVTFALWAVATGLHTVFRVVPTIHTMADGRMTGRLRRTMLVVAMLVIAVVAAVLMRQLAAAWF